MREYDSIFELKISSKALKIASRYSYLPYMIERYMRIFPEDELIEFLDKVEEGVPRSIRCNTLLLEDCRLLVERLEERGFELEQTGILSYAYRVVNESGSLGSTIEHLLGYYYIQGIGSMLTSVLLSPREGEFVADLASAPGGKTTHMAQIMNNKGCILSVDKSLARVKKLRSNIQRMHVKNTVVLRKDILRITGLEEFFDKVLLDAPCTGEGLIVFKKERKTSRTMDDLRKMSGLQIQLLEKAMELLKPGGTLLYSTCSIAPEENEYVLSNVLSRRDDIEVLPTRYGRVGSPGIVEYNNTVFHDDMRKCLRVYPHRDGMEGFFYCLLRKR